MDDFDLSICIGGVDENDLIVDLNNTFVHLSQRPVSIIQSAGQKIIFGLNDQGKPEGFWFAPKSTWLKFLHDNDNPICCYIYDVTPNMRNMLVINTAEEFEEFDKKYSNYWPNLDYLSFDFRGYQLGGEDSDLRINIVATRDIDKEWKEAEFTPGETYFDAAARLGMIFTTQDATKNCKHYVNHPEWVEFFRYKIWDDITPHHDGIIINDWANNSAGMKYFWYQMLNFSSGCIWNQQGLLDIILIKTKKTPTKWIDSDSISKNIDQNTLFKKIKESSQPETTFIHLSTQPLPIMQNSTQQFMFGWNIFGRPTGLWIAPKEEWLTFNDKNNLDVCCYLYDVKPIMSHILYINSTADFKKFDKKYGNYWPNLEFITRDRNQNVVDTIKKPEFNLVATRHANQELSAAEILPDETLYDKLIRLGMIFTTPEDAIKGCKHYTDHPEYITLFKYKNWDEVTRDYDGIMINNWDKNREGMKYFWYQSWDLSSGCIWNAQGIRDVIQTTIKRTPTEWIGGVDENVIIENLKTSIRPENMFVHLSNEPIGKLTKTQQLYMLDGINFAGRPAGLWITHRDEWLTFRQSRDWSSCCYLYDVNTNMDQLLVINNATDFKKFDKKYSNYWPNLDYFNFIFTSYTSEGKRDGPQIIMNGIRNARNEFDAAEFHDDNESLYDSQLRLRMIFTTAEDAIRGCKQYSDNPKWIEFFRCKNWEEITLDYSGIVFNNWADNHEGMKYFWYQSIELSSGCIWNPAAVKEIIPSMIKKTPTDWEDFTIGGNETIKRTYIHSCKTPLKPMQIIRQRIMDGPNSMGKPDGFWISPGNDWIEYCTDNDMRQEDRYQYEVKLNDNVLIINTIDDFEKFDRKYSNYWPQLDKIGHDVNVSGDDLVKEFRKAGVLFTSTEDAIKGCSKYRGKNGSKNLIYYKYKNWAEVARDYAGIVFNNWANNTASMQYQWYHILDVSSGCIWDPAGIYEITLLSEKTGGLDNIIVNSPSQDQVISSLIPAEISECALYLGKKLHEPCASDKMVTKLAEVVGTTSEDPTTIVEKAKQITGKSSEKEAIIALIDKIGKSMVAREIAMVHKIKGPTSAALLSNTNIDATLQQWMIAFPEFFAYNFNMRDYASYSFRHGEVINSPDTLATIGVDELYTGKIDRPYTKAACVINSDVYNGPGKHWMALFVDMSVVNTTVEFFNSSGNAPAPEWINWLEKSRSMIENMGLKCKIVRVSTIRHQSSKSECGVYSLFYIWARLHNVPHSYFSKKVPDQVMFEFRQHIFADPTRPAMEKFNWTEYSNRTKIAWESESTQG